MQLLYDGDCCFCARCVKLLAAWDRAGRVEKVPFQAAGVLEAHPDLTAAEAHGAIQFYDALGRRWSGADALREMARNLPLGAPVALALGLPGIRWIADRAYRCVARNRHRVGCKSSACSVNPRRSG